MCVREPGRGEGFRRTIYKNPTTKHIDIDMPMPIPPTPYPYPTPYPVSPNNNKTQPNLT